MSKNQIILGLSIALAFCLILIFKLEQPGKKIISEENLFFGTEVPDSVATIWIKNYRKRWSLSKKNNIVLYDSDVIRKYLDSIYPVLTQRIIKPDTLSWMIGFYCMRKTDQDHNNKNKLDFLVVPTIVDRPNNGIIRKVYDFQEYPEMYTQTKKVKMTDPPCSTCTGYDAGHLWP